MFWALCKNGNCSVRCSDSAVRDALQKIASMLLTSTMQGRITLPRSLHCSLLCGRHIQLLSVLFEFSLKLGNLSLQFLDLQKQCLIPLRLQIIRQIEALMKFLGGNQYLYHGNDAREKDGQEHHRVDKIIGLYTICAAGTQLE